MFGYHKLRKTERRAQEALGAANREKYRYSVENIARENKERGEIGERAKKGAEESRMEREKGYQRGQARSQEIFSRNVQGLTPEERNAIQSESNRLIDRGQRSSNRQLLANQGQRGISGKSGVAYAQQRDIQRMAGEARGQAQNDLNKLESERKRQNLGAMVALEQGEAAQTQLDRQMALDQERTEVERKRNRYLEDESLRQYNRQFNRV